MRFMSASMAHLGKRLFSTRLNTAVRVDSKNRKVFVKYPDGKETSYLFLWLRDHSLAAQHRNAETKQRLTRLEELDLNVSPVNVHCDESSMSLVWPDETVSKYEFSWLRANSHEPNISCERINEHKPVYWGSELANNLPTVDYRRVMDTSDDAGLAEWLTLTEQYGISFVDNVPVTTKDTELLANRLAFIRETHYGKFWEFTSNLAHNDLAYSTSYLAGHTDTTYFTDPIGLQLFHVLHHRDGSGGKSLYVDAFNVARQMQAKFPEEYTVLQNTAIGSHAAGDGGVFMQPTPLYHTIFNHDKITDELYQVRFNNDDRSVLNHLSHSQQTKFYDALLKWDRLLRLPKNELWVQNRPGKAVIINNWRVLHGRAAFTGNRRLCGAYINYDDYKSRLKCVVYKELGKKYL